MCYVQIRFLSMVSHPMGTYHEPHGYQPVLWAISLSTIHERRNMTDSKFSNGLIPGSIDAPRLHIIS